MPATDHIARTVFEPSEMIHRNPAQWGVATRKGDVNAPYRVVGVQKYTYKFAAV